MRENLNFCRNVATRTGDRFTWPRPRWRLMRCRPVAARRTVRRAGGVRGRRCRRPDDWKLLQRERLRLRLERMRWRWRHQVRREPETVPGGRMLLVKSREVLLVVMMLLLLLLLLVSCRGGCSGRSRHGVRTSAAGCGQLLVQASGSLHLGPLVPQVLASGRCGRIVYTAQRPVRSAHCGRGCSGAQEQLRPGCQHGPFLGGQLAKATGRIHQRRTEHVLLAQHGLHRFPAKTTWPFGNWVLGPC